MGPISLRPTHRLGLGPSKRPERPRATFNRRHGTRYAFGAFEVHADRLRLRLRRRRAGADTLGFMRTIRSGYARRTRLYWIQDDLSANWTPDIRGFAAANNIEFVPIPTYASSLNRIEAHFRPINEFVVANADYLDWDAFAHALAPRTAPQRPRPRPVHRRARAQAHGRRLTHDVPVQRSEKAH